MTHVIAGVLLAATVLIAPGLLLARLGGVRGWGAVSAALPLSCAVIGISEVVAAAGGWAWVPWGWATIAGLTALAAAVLTIARRIWFGRWLPAGPFRDGSGSRRPDLRVPAGVVAACLILAVGILAGIGSMSTPAQSFDIVFHFNAVQAIRQLGNASSFGSMAALYQGAPTYYPTVWHGVVALLPADVAVASNSMVLVVGALAWPLGITGLLVEVLDDGAQSRSRTAIALGAVLSAATVGAPTMLLGTLAVWAYSLSVVCLPGVVVLGLRLLRSLPCEGAFEDAFARDSRTAPAAPAESEASAELAELAESAAPAAPAAPSVSAEPAASAEPTEPAEPTAPSTPFSGLLMNGLLFVGGGAGVVLAHGAGTFNTMVLLGPLAAVLVVRLVRAGGRRRTLTLRALAVLAVFALLGAWKMRESLAWVWKYPRSGGNLLGALGQSLLDLPQYGPFAFKGMPMSIGVPLGIVVCGLAVLAAVRVPRARPWLVTAALALLLLTLVGGPQWWGRRIGALWYLQKARIQPLVIIPGLVLAAMGLRHLLDKRPGRKMVALLLALVCATAVGRLPLHAKLVRSVHDADRIAYGMMLTPEDVEFISGLGDLLPEDAVVLGAPARGESYLWSLGGVDVLYPLRSRPTVGSAADRLAAVAPDLRPGSTTCRLLHEVGAEYYLRTDRSGTMWEDRQAPLRWDRALADWPTDGMEPVASTSTLSLWRITSCEG